MQPVERKIAVAKGLLKDYEEVLAKEKGLISLLEGLRRAIEATEIERKITGISEFCAWCGSLNHDCCGAGIELRYSAELLFINLLLGAGLPESRRREDSCYFLSPRGCCLKARVVFCVNFLCRKITETIEPSRLVQLQRREGEMLDLIFKVEEIIKGLFSFKFDKMYCKDHV